MFFKLKKKSWIKLNVPMSLGYEMKYWTHQHMSWNYWKSVTGNKVEINTFVKKRKLCKEKKNSYAMETKIVLLKI